MTDAVLTITVCVSLRARHSTEVILQLPAGSTVLDAIRHSAVLADLTDEEIDRLQTAVRGRRQPPNHGLSDGDRVELLRALKVDPKVARRERFTRQGARATGLFSKRRAGAKSGY